jgi:hypothetical protein
LLKAVNSEKRRVWSRQSAKLPGATDPRWTPASGIRSQTIISRSWFGKEKGRKSSALTQLKMVVFAPMPKAIASTATTVKPGFFVNIRSP